MSCYHPIEAWDLSPDFEHDLKRTVVFNLPAGMDRQKLRQQGRLLQLPCRHCVGCRLSKSREWANRVVMEQTYHDDAWFVTLTYDDEHLPCVYSKSALGTNLSVHSTLVKSDLQKFLSVFVLILNSIYVILLLESTERILIDRIIMYLFLVLDLMIYL